MPQSSTAFRRALRTALRARIAALPAGDPCEGTIVSSAPLTLEGSTGKAIGLGDWRTIGREEGPMRGPARRQVNETALQSGSIGVTTSAVTEDGLDDLEDLADALVELLAATLQEGEGIFGADQNRRPGMLATLVETRGALQSGPEQTGQYVQVDFTISYDARL